MKRILTLALLLISASCFPQVDTLSKASSIGQQIGRYVRPQNTFQGKRALLITDSFGEESRGLYRPNLHQLGFVDANIIIDAVPGSCIASGTTTAEGDGTNRVPILDRLITRLAAATSTPSLRPDLIVIEGGINDVYYNVPLGTLSDNSTTTYYGALNAIKTALLSYGYPTQILFINQTRRGSNKKNGSAINYSVQSPYAQAATLVLQPACISVLDMYFLGWDYTQASVYTEDGTHPNSFGALIFTNRWYNAVVNPIQLAQPVNYFTNNYYGGGTPTYQNQLIDWTALYLATYDAGTHTVTESGAGGGWIASAKAPQTINTHGNTGEIARLTIPSIVKYDGVVCGFSTVTSIGTSNNFENIKYGMYNNVSVIRVFEEGVNVAETAMPTGTVKLEIVVSDTDVKYYINDVIFYTNSIPPAFPLYVHAAFGSYDENPPYSITNAALKSYQ